MRSTRTPGRHGQVLILFMLFLVVLVGICVLTIDIGRMVVADAELQNAVDAAAMAGAAFLGGVDKESDKIQARSEATALAAANEVCREGLTLSESDITFGRYDPDTQQFIPEDSTSRIDSIRVMGRRTNESPDGPVDLFFGSLFGFDQVEIKDVIAVGTKPRRFVMFVLDRSGSMCFDTTGVTRHDSLIDGHDAEGYHMLSSSSGWYWMPERAYRKDAYGNWYWQTAWMYAKDDATGEIRTDFLPAHIQARLQAGQYFNFRGVDYPDTITTGWVKVPAGVTVYDRFTDPWFYWWADDYYDVVSAECGYATSSGPVQPLQSTMDAACAFVDLLKSQDDLAGLVTYAYKGVTESILTNDFYTLEAKLQSFAPHGSTAEPDGMKNALDELIDSGRANGFGKRIMILLTDGCANMSNGGSYDNNTRTYTFLGQTITSQIHPTVAAAMATQAQRAKAGGVLVYCVTFGAGADTALHSVLAAYTGADHYHAAEHESLPDVFVDIFRRLPPMITQ
jgi:hypothetical protein